MVQWFDEDHGINVVYIAMPTDVNECTTVNEEGSYTVFINASVCNEKQMSGYNHALFHISNDDFYKKDVNEIEVNAHENA